jgi:hypothetical protein
MQLSSSGSGVAAVRQMNERGSSVALLRILIELTGILVPAAALWWVYWRTRLPAVFVYFLWHVFGPSTFQLLTLPLAGLLHRSYWSSAAITEALHLYSVVGTGIGAGLFTWMVLTLFQLSRPDVTMPWRPRRPLSVAIADQD